MPVCLPIASRLQVEAQKLVLKTTPLGSAAPPRGSTASSSTAAPEGERGPR